MNARDAAPDHLEIAFARRRPAPDGTTWVPSLCKAGSNRTPAIRCPFLVSEHGRRMNHSVAVAMRDA